MTCQLSLIYVCDLIKMLCFQDGSSFMLPLSNYDINVGTETEVEIYRIACCVQLGNVPISRKYYKDTF